MKTVCQWSEYYRIPNKILDTFPACTELLGCWKWWWGPKQLLEFLNTPGQYKMDPVVLSYMDNVLQLDVSLLDPPSWLNDHDIGFVFEYFANSQFHNCTDHVCFISPEVTQFIKFTGNPAEMALFLEQLDLPNKRVIFLAISDNSTHAAGGTHWSLFVYLQDKNGFFSLWFFIVVVTHSLQRR